MKFGNYNLTTATNDENNDEERRNGFEIKLSKIKLTARYLVGKLNARIEIFRKLGVRSESPLSFETALFAKHSRRKSDNHRNTVGKIAEEKFSQKDFPRTNMLTDQHFCTNFSQFKFHKLNGKNEFIRDNYNYYAKYSEHKTDNNLKQLLEFKIDDEDEEYRILKDYFETNSYSDIIKDSDFKTYLNLKNYSDILDVINSDSYKSRIKADDANKDSDYEPIYNNNRVYKTWGHNRPVQNNCKTIKSNRIPRSLSINIYDSLKRMKQILTKPDQSSLAPVDDLKKQIYLFHHKNCGYARRYCELIEYIEDFLNNYLDIDSKNDQNRNKTSSFSNKKYNEIIKQFLKKQNATSKTEYIENKYGKLLENSMNISVEQKDTSAPKNIITKKVEKIHQKPKQLSESTIKTFLFKDSFKTFEYVNYTLPLTTKSPSTDKINFKNYNNFFFNQQNIIPNHECNQSCTTFDEPQQYNVRERHQKLTDSDYLSENNDASCESLNLSINREQNLHDAVTPRKEYFFNNNTKWDQISQNNRRKRFESDFDSMYSSDYDVIYIFKILF